ncbi:MAG: hypothetical protein WEB67_07815 [Acidimicrobiia bacterium]
MSRFSPLVILGAAAAVVIALFRRAGDDVPAPEPEWRPVDPE